MRTKKFSMARKFLAFIALALVISVTFVMPVMAEDAATASPIDEATTAVNEMFDNLWMVLSIIVSAIGAAVTLFGLVQLGTSFAAHDPSQRITGALTIAGGIVIILAPWFVKMITG